MPKRDFARELRQNQTEVERRLWSELRSRRFHGFKFRRQEPVGPFIADFLCLEAKLIIELDGARHALPQFAAAERRRNAYLENRGYRIKRYWNGEVKGDLRAVLRDIRIALEVPVSK
jgi:very-short-patch-repair endonuclease